MQNLEQELRVDNLVSPQASDGSTPILTNAGMYRSMAKYRKGLVVVIAHLTEDKTCVAQLTCDVGATATAGKANVTLKTVTLTGQAGGSEEVGVIEFDVNDLTAIAATKYFVGVDLVANQAADLVAAVLVRGAARYYMGTSMPV